MIDREKISYLITEAKLCVLEEIQLLSRIATELDVIWDSIDGPENDEYLQHLTENQCNFRKSIQSADDRMRKNEEALVNELLRIISEEDES